MTRQFLCGGYIKFLKNLCTDNHLGALQALLQDRSRSGLLFRSVTVIEINQDVGVEKDLIFHGAHLSSTSGPHFHFVSSSRDRARLRWPPSVAPAVARLRRIQG